MAKSIVEEEIGIPNAGDFVSRYDNMYVNYDGLKEKATPAMESVYGTVVRTSLTGLFAIGASLLLDGIVDTWLLALILTLPLLYAALGIYSALSRLCPLHVPIRDWAIIEEEFLRDLHDFRDSEYLGLGEKELVALKRLEFTPGFSYLNKRAYMLIVLTVMLVVYVFMVAFIPVFF